MEAYKVKVRYNKLFDKLKENNLTQKEFKLNANISGGTMQKLISNDSITTNTICKICDYFHCMPDEIMEFIPDSDYEDKRKQKAEVEQQIATLQAKLKQM